MRVCSIAVVLGISFSGQIPAWTAVVVNGDYSVAALDESTVNPLGHVGNGLAGGGITYGPDGQLYWVWEHGIFRTDMQLNNFTQFVHSVQGGEISDLVPMEIYMFQKSPTQILRSADFCATMQIVARC